MGYRNILLTRGQVAIVDECDYGELSKHRWYALLSPVTDTYYACRMTTKPDGKRYMVYMHRVIMGVTGVRPSVDHINRCGTDNRRENLRLCATDSLNHANQVKRRGNTSSRYKGVCWVKGKLKWRAEINHSGRRHLGYFTNEEDAARAYDRAAQETFGEFARLNLGGTE